MRTARKLLVRGLDALFAASIALLALVASTEPALAYVDPSVMTYTIQALAGVAVALSAVLGVVWRRARKHLLRALRIDENASKVVEGDVHDLEAAGRNRDELLAEADERARVLRAEQGAERPERLCWGARLLFALLASVLLAFTVLVVAPLEIVAGSSDSLFFGVGSVWAPVSFFAAAVAAALALAMSALHGRAFNVAFAVVVALGVAAYVQAMLLNGGLPPADGNAVEWGAYTKVTVGSGLVWLGIVTICVACSLKRSLAFKGAASLAAVAIVAAQAIGLGMLLGQTPGDGRSPGVESPSVTMQGMFDVSGKSNVIMFVLDTFDTRYLDQALAEDPGALAEMEGFTYYRNSAGSMIPTRYAMASLITGRALTEEDHAFSNSLITSWYADDNLLDEAARLGYDAGVYASDVPQGMDALTRKTINVHGIPRFTGDFWPTVEVLGRCALYRDLPWALKPGFWFYTDELNDAIMPSAGDLDRKPWLLDDAEFYQDLGRHGLDVEKGGANGSFRIIHLTGAHYPYSLNERGERVEENAATLEQQCLGSLRIVGEYLRQLKELGVYDRSAVVITADHGEWYLTEEIDRVTSPILLVKPAGAARGPVTVSEVPTGHVDVAATLVDAMGGDAAAWGTPVYDVADGPRTRSYDATSVIVEDDFRYDAIKRWAITGEVLDWQNWHSTGIEWPISSD